MIAAETSNQTDDASLGPKRRRPGGRNERIRLSVAEAVLSFFREGRADASVAEVADRAGVHRSTVYRRWPSPADLLREALTVHTDRIEIPDRGRWEEDVRTLATELADFFADPVEITMNSAMASGRDPALTRVLVEHWTPLFTQIGTVITKAIERGEIRRGTNPALVIDLIVSPLLMRTILFGTKPSDDEVHELADAVTRSARS